MNSPEPSELSERELDILRLVATGASNKDIAQKLFISTNTVKVHIRNIFTKIGVTSRTEAAMYAVQNGIVTTAASQIKMEEDNSLISVELSQSNQAISIENLNQKKQPLRYLLIFITIIFGVVMIGFVLFRERLLPVQPATASTPTQRVQWFELPGLTIPRRSLAVTSYANQIFAIGGENGEGITNAVEKYDPKTNLWSALNSKPLAVSEINAGVLGGLIFVPGGKQLDGKPTNITEIYDPLSDTWSTGIPLPIPLCAYGLVVSEGRIYVFGGWDGKSIRNNAYVFNPELNIWSEIPPMPTARSFPGAVAVGSKIYILGGWDGQKALSTSEVYLTDHTDLESPWTTAGSLPSPRYGMGITNLADMIFIIGGTSPEDDLSVIALSQEDAEWKKLETPMLPGWFFLGATTIGSRLYALGGEIESVLSNQMWSYQALFTITLPIVR
jgi:DNA-binding CsgD family transcriptional regulator